MKKLFILILLSSFVFASYEKVKVGTISPYYSNKISEFELEQIIKEVEIIFENQLNMNVFDYSYDGKPIDIVYIKASTLERRIKRKEKLLDSKLQKIKRFQKSFDLNQKQIKINQKILNEKTKNFNRKVKSLNEYIKGKNSQKSISKSEYEKIKKYVSSKRRSIDKELKLLKKEQRNTRKLTNRFNQKIFSYNNQIRDYNRQSKQLESMLRRFKKVKGKAFGVKEIKLKTYYKNGKKVKQEKVVTNSMNKIEIYGFESKAELKAVLAHEIAHLLGLPHTNTKKALMNPILQKNQLEKLELLPEDIALFRKYF